MRIGDGATTIGKWIYLQENLEKKEDVLTNCCFNLLYGHISLWYTTIALILWVLTEHRHAHMLF